MKRLFTILMALTIICAMATAQNTGYQKAVAKYKNVSSLTATAIKTTHKATVKKDKQLKGTLSVKGSDKVIISFNKGDDALIMNGEQFTMVVKAARFKTSATNDTMFKTFHDVLTSIFSGGTPDIANISGVKAERKGNNILLTINATGAAANNKKQRNTSFTQTIDANRRELRNIRLKGKGGNYTQYTFSNYTLGAPVSDKLFK